jgi:hypothetical protein
MEILSHRGYWLTPQEKNQKIAFERSFERGFGTETDVRDSGGKLVISHDMPRGDEMTLTAMLDILGDRNLPLALNIKADGLGPAILDAMAGRSQNLWFTFDMSVPELIRQKKLAMPVFTRRSEYELQATLYDVVEGVWLDCFHGLWFNADDIVAMLDDGKRVCIVSPELHGRAPTELWSMLRRAGLYDSSIMICTDVPEKLQSEMKDSTC